MNRETWGNVLSDFNSSIHSLLTLIGTHGNSGNALATALAPDSLVKSEIPTKNSLPVNRTSPPSSFAFGSAISTSAKSSSFLRIARVFSTYKKLKQIIRI